MPKERPTCGKMVKYKSKMQFQKLAPSNQEMYKTVRTENRGIRLLPNNVDKCKQGMTEHKGGLLRLWHSGLHGTFIGLDYG